MGYHVHSNDILTFSPGLYCLKGDFDVNANAVIWAENVTLRFNSGTTKFNGTAELHLTAPNCETSALRCWSCSARFVNVYPAGK